MKKQLPAFTDFDQRLTKHRYFFYKQPDRHSNNIEYLNPGGGLERFIVDNKIEERRVTVEHTHELQELLDAGERLILYKVRHNFQDSWRITRTIIMDAENTYIDGANIVYKGTSKPAAENNIYPEQIQCIHQFLAIFDERFDLSPSQQARGKKVKGGRLIRKLNNGVVVAKKPSSKARQKPK